MTTAPVQFTSFIGRGLLQKQALGLLFSCTLLPVVAAPLDSLLTAIPETTAPKGYLEIGSDNMNAQLDFFKIRDQDALAAGTQAGDYRGAHVAGSWRMRDNAWLSGSFWQRDLSGLSETYHFNSWQLSGMYRMVEADGKVPALALRLSAFENFSNEIGASNICAAPVATNPGVCQLNAYLDRVKISKPADKTLQADLIATWPLSASTDLTLMLGGGRTELSYGDVRAVMKRSDGLIYDLSFIGNDIFGTTADGSSQFRDQASKYGIDIAKELAWRGNFVQLGFNASWRNGPWTLRGGYLYYAIEREGLDDVLARRGWSNFSQIRNVTMEASYRFNPHLSGFVRSQLGTSLMFNDMPVIYNSYSSDLFGGRYSVYTVGLRADF